VKKLKISIAFLAICLLAINIGLSQGASLTAFPNDSNIFALNGTGFTRNETVTIVMHDGNSTVFSFLNCTADNAGLINATEIIPTSIYGQYNITATGQTSNITLTLINFVVPNLTGANGTSITGSVGPTGIPGVSGIPGVKGDKGDTGDTNDIATLAIGISLICVLIEVTSIILAQRRKHTPAF
jgi:hypothetical protein